MHHGLPTLELTKPDGSLLTRIEAEKHVRDVCKTSHVQRRFAWGQLGLDYQFVWMMKPITVTHWILDELIRKKQIAGDLLGIQPELDTDDSYFNSFIQRLAVFVQDGRALQPKEGEGIIMADFQQMGPPNGQPPGAPGYNPPPPPAGFGPPPQPPGYAPQQPPQGYAPPQQGFAPPQQGFGPPPMQPPPQQYQQPQQPSFPPQGAPPPIPPPQMAPPSMGAPPPAMGAPQTMAPPPMGAPPQQPQMAPPGQPPAPPAQAPSNRRGRGKAAEGAPPQPGVLPGQQALPLGNAQQPQGFGAPPAMAGFGPPAMGQPQQQQGGGDTAALQAQINELKGLVAAQSRQLEGLLSMVGQVLHLSKGTDAAVSCMIRPYYEKQLPQQPQQLGTEATFKEIGLPYPS